MPDFDALGYYEILGVEPDAPISEIKRKYYERAKYWHPDRNDSPQAQDMFQRISTAYDVLQDESKRLVYDLLSSVYSEQDFPQMGSLKVYKNQNDKDDRALRVLKQYHAVCGKVVETKDICNIYEAGSMVVSTSVSNWLKGWWGKNGFDSMSKALKYNMQTVYADDMDNLKLLVHNAVAYAQENNQEMAWIYAMQADRMVDDESYLKILLHRFIENLDYHLQQKIEIPYWDAAWLKRRQRFFPLSLLAVSLLAVFFVLFQLGFLKSETDAVGYYEERVFADGTRMPSDTIVNRIIKTDSTPNNEEYLMNFKQECMIYYGPDERYSSMQPANLNQTIRVSGFTSDKQWYQIIIDNGEPGYVRAECLQKGIGKPVPRGSKVFKGHK